MIPQALPTMLSYGLLYWESEIRAATLLGLVGAGGSTRTSLAAPFVSGLHRSPERLNIGICAGYTGRLTNRLCKALQDGTIKHGRVVRGPAPQEVRWTDSSALKL